MILVDPRKNCSPSLRSARGFTLIEVLVAMIVLAVGVMGVALMQVQTYKELQSSHNIGYAAMLAGEMADRMLANPAQTLKGNYSRDPGIAPVSGFSKDCSKEDCWLYAISIYDVKNWHAKVGGSNDARGALPSGSGEVEQLSDTEYRVIVRWDDDLSGSTGTDCLPDPNELDCYVINVAVQDPNDLL